MYVYLWRGEAYQRAHADTLALHLRLLRYDRSRRVIGGNFNCGVNAMPMQRLAALCRLRILMTGTHKTYPRGLPARRRIILRVTTSLWTLKF